MNDGLKWTKKEVVMASFKVMFHYFLGPRTRELLSLPRYEFWSS
jgi:hypothetical protein